MTYSVLILRRAQKEFGSISGKLYEQTKKAISDLAENPRLHGCRKLIGREGWRLRIENYRVIYEIDDQNCRVTILHIGHRKDVYY
jgi:mRNA interferase RelE/StbE